MRAAGIAVLALALAAVAAGLWWYGFTHQA